MQGLQVACRKRPISAAQLDRVADEIEAEMQESADREISSRRLGNMVMEKLRDLDVVAYVRFASVYRRFEDVEQFVRELHQLKEEDK
jgi:transcriptional repressor NrdR